MRRLHPLRNKNSQELCQSVREFIYRRWKLIFVLFPYAWDQVLIESAVKVKIRLPCPVFSGGGIVHFFWPGIDNFLPATINGKIDFCVWEGLQDDVVDILGGHAETGHVIHELG